MISGIFKAKVSIICVLAKRVRVTKSFNSVALERGNDFRSVEAAIFMLLVVVPCGSSHSRGEMSL